MCKMPKVHMQCTGPEQGCDPVFFFLVGVGGCLRNDSLTKAAHLKVLHVVSARPVRYSYCRSSADTGGVERMDVNYHITWFTP